MLGINEVGLDDVGRNLDGNEVIEGEVVDGIEEGIVLEILFTIGGKDGVGIKVIWELFGLIKLGLSVGEDEFVGSADELSTKNKLFKINSFFFGKKLLLRYLDIWSTNVDNNSSEAMPNWLNRKLKSFASILLENWLMW